MITIFEEAFTPEEVAERLKITKYTVYEMIKRGDLNAFKVGNKMRIQSSELQDFVRRSTTKPKKTENTSTVNNILKITGSHDFLLESLIQFQQNRLDNTSIHPSYVGSLEGLMTLFRGQADIAAIHLLNADTNEYNLPFIKQLFPLDEITMIRLAARSQGLIVAKGNPLDISTIADIANKKVRFVNRQKGSGTRILFDQLLVSNDAPPTEIIGYDNEEWSHLATASQVASGKADVTFGISSSAEKLGLDFIPVTSEYFDLVLKWTSKNTETLEQFMTILKSQDCRNMLSILKEYDMSELGNIIYEKREK